MRVTEIFTQSPQGNGFIKTPYEIPYSGMQVLKWKVQENNDPTNPLSFEGSTVKYKRAGHRECIFNIFYTYGNHYFGECIMKNKWDLSLRPVEMSQAYNEAMKQKLTLEHLENASSEYRIEIEGPIDLPDKGIKVTKLIIGGGCFLSSIVESGYKAFKLSRIEDGMYIGDRGSEKPSEVLDLIPSDLANAFTGIFMED